VAKQTVNLGTIPNSGLDGDDARTAFTKVNENFSELYNAMGGASGTVSPKLTAVANSVWAANQLLMASGANTLAMLTTGATGRALIAAANAAAGRAALSLGTAAVANLTTTSTDNTPNSVLKVGDFGLGGTTGILVTDFNALTVAGTYQASTANSQASGLPIAAGHTLLHFPGTSAVSGALQLAWPSTSVVANQARMWRRAMWNSGWSAWVEIPSVDTVATILGAVGWGAAGVTGSKIPSGTDLNTMVTPGSYGQELNNNATLVLNYPATQAGTLLVQAAAANIVTQQYTNYNSGVSWTRSRYNDTWSPWKKTTTAEDTGFGADQSGTSGKYLMLPATPNNVAATCMIASLTTDIQATSHAPEDGVLFGGIHGSRQLRPWQVGVSGQGANAKLFFRGYSGSTSAVADWLRAMTVGDFGLGSFSTRITDANSPTVTGMFRLAGSDANVPETTSGCSVWHNQQTATIAAQIAIVTTNGNVWTRTNNAGTWTAWRISLSLDSAITGYTLGSNAAVAATDTVLAAMGKLQAQINNIRTIPLTGYVVGANSAVAATDTLLGAIGKLQGQINATQPISRGGTGATTAAAARTNLGLGSAAVVDVVGAAASGAVMERGSSSNGEYIRFQDGTQICWIRAAIGAVGTNAAIGNIFFSAVLGFNPFPAAFVSPPTVTYSIAAIGDGTLWCSAAGDSTATTPSSIYAVSPLNSTKGTVFYGYIAVGRWK